MGRGDRAMGRQACEKDEGHVPGPRQELPCPLTGLRFVETQDEDTRRKVSLGGRKPGTDGHRGPGGQEGCLQSPAGTSPSPLPHSLDLPSAVLR